MRFLHLTLFLVALLGLASAQPCSLDEHCPESMSCAFHTCLEIGSLELGSLCAETKNCFKHLVCSNNRCVPEDPEILFSSSNNKRQESSSSASSASSLGRSLKDNPPIPQCFSPSDCSPGEYCDYLGSCVSFPMWKLGVGIGVASFFSFFMLLPIFMCFVTGTYCFSGMGKCGNRQKPNGGGQAPPSHAI